MNFYSIPQACNELGIAYHKVYYALLKREITPMQSGRARILTQDDVNTLKKHFETMKGK